MRPVTAPAGRPASAGALEHPRGPVEAPGAASAGQGGMLADLDVEDGLAAPERALHDPHHVVVQAGQDLLHRTPDVRLAGKAAHPGERGIHADEAQLGVDRGEADGSVVEQALGMRQGTHGVGPCTWKQRGNGAAPAARGGIGAGLQNRCSRPPSAMTARPRCPPRPVRRLLRGGCHRANRRPAPPVTSASRRR